MSRRVLALLSVGFVVLLGVTLIALCPQLLAFPFGLYFLWLLCNTRFVCSDDVADGGGVRVNETDALVEGQVTIASAAA